MDFSFSFVICHDDDQSTGQTEIDLFKMDFSDRRTAETLEVRWSQLINNLELFGII